MKRFGLALLLLAAFTPTAQAEWTEDAELCATIVGDSERAIRHCEAAIASGVLSDEDLSTTWSNLAYELDESDRYQEAVEAATQAIGIFHQNARAFQNRANTYQNMGKLELAIADYKHTLTLLKVERGDTTAGVGPELGAHHGLAEIYRNLNRREDGMQHAIAVFEIEPTYNPDLMTWYGLQ